MSTVEDRNKRLDALEKATGDWVDTRTRELNNNVQTVKNILKGRTGSERLAQAASQGAQDLVVSQIDDFLATT